MKRCAGNIGLARRGARGARLWTPSGSRVEPVLAGAGVFVRAAGVGFAVVWDGTAAFGLETETTGVSAVHAKSGTPTKSSKTKAEVFMEEEG